MKDRNMPYPVYPMPYGMPGGQCPPMGMMPNMPVMPPYKGHEKGHDGYKSHEMMEQKLAALDKRVTNLENLVGASGAGYSTSNYQVM